MTIGLVVNTTVKPCRDVMLEISRCIQEHDDVWLSSFYGTPSTTMPHLSEFASSGVDGLIICGFRKEQIQRFLRYVPKRPPVVLGTYGQIQQKDREMLGCGGTVMLDNEQIGSLAADFFRKHGLQNFAFLGNNIYREFVASEIRCAAFENRLRAVCGESISFDKMMVGHVETNEDCWENSRARVEKWLKKLPKPCGVFVNGEIEAFKFIRLCKMQGFDVPGQIEVLAIDNAYGFCEQSKPTISGITIDFASCAREALRMLMSLITNPRLPKSLCDVKVGVAKLTERSSTASGRGYGLIVERAKEYIRVNACSGIGIDDVANYLGVSRRLLEVRVRESLGQGVLSLIHDVKLNEVCRLLKTTNISITDVATKAGYPLTGNLGILFKKTFGVSMREYRNAHNNF